MKHYENLDDFNDGSRPPLFDWVEWLAQRVIAGGAIWLVLALCGALENL